MKTQPKRIKLIQRASIAPETMQAYKKDLVYFWAWSAAIGRKRKAYPVPASVVQRFALEHIEGLSKRVDEKLIQQGVKRPGRHKVGTIYRRLMALAWAHRQRGLSSPTRDDQLKALMASARRLQVRDGITPKRSAPITKRELDKMLATINLRTLHGVRARAVLEFGFYTGGRRRSEIATAHTDHLTPAGKGFYYNLHISKTDQTGKGRIKLLRSYQSKGLRAWLKKAQITDGFIFRSIDRAGRITDRAMPPAVVNSIIKTYAERAGLDPTIYSGHGLRRGFVTHCGREGVPFQDVMALTDHANVQQAMVYYEQGAIHRNRATRI